MQRSAGLLAPNGIAVLAVALCAVALLAVPDSAGAGECQGESCRGPGSVPVPVPGAGSAGFEAPGPLGLFGARKVRGPRAALRAIVPAPGRLTVSGGGLVPVEKSAPEAGALPLTLVLTPAAERKRQRQGVFRSEVEAIFVASNGDASRANVALKFEAPAGGEGGR